MHKRVDIGNGKRLARLGYRRGLSALLLGVTKWKKKVPSCSYMVRLSELGLRPTMCHQRVDIGRGKRPAAMKDKGEWFCVMKGHLR